MRLRLMADQTASMDFLKIWTPRSLPLCLESLSNWRTHNVVVDARDEHSSLQTLNSHCQSGVVHCLLDLADGQLLEVEDAGR